MSHRARRLLLVLIPAAAVCLAPSVRGVQGRPQRAEVRLAYRSTQPGEVIRLDIRADRPIQSALIKFGGRSVFPARGRDRTHMLAFIGLDLTIKPGRYRLDMDIRYEDGGGETLEETVDVADKTFPEKRLRVDQAYVTPPASVQERIRRESELVGAVYQILTPQWLGQEGFIIPVDGDIVPNFGERRIFNGQPRSPHSGVDISSPMGAPVGASNSGRVVLASDLYFSGKTVIIDHGAGVFSLYCHFSKILAERGDFVNKGDVIGEVGATGRVTGPHLHWAFRVNGKRVDPLSLVALAWDE